MLNFIERFILKRALKRTLKKLPFFKNKDIKEVEKKAEELYKKIKETITNFLKEHTN